MNEQFEIGEVVELPDGTYGVVESVDSEGFVSVLNMESGKREAHTKFALLNCGEEQTFVTYETDGGYASMPEKSAGKLWISLADGSVNPAVIDRVDCDALVACSDYTKACNGRTWGFNFVDASGTENEICFECFERLAGVELRNQP